MSALMMTVTNTAHDGVESLEPVDEVIAHDEMSVTHTPKTMVAALVVAVVAGLIAYQESPTSVATEISRNDSAVVDHAASKKAPHVDHDSNDRMHVRETVSPLDQWAAVEAATMSPALEG